MDGQRRQHRVRDLGVVHVLCVRFDEIDNATKLDTDAPVGQAQRVAHESMGFVSAAAERLRRRRKTGADHAVPVNSAVHARIA